MPCYIIMLLPFVVNCNAYSVYFTGMSWGHMKEWIWIRWHRKSTVTYKRTVVSIRPWNILFMSQGLQNGPNLKGEKYTKNLHLGPQLCDGHLWDYS